MSMPIALHLAYLGWTIGSMATPVGHPGDSFYPWDSHAPVNLITSLVYQTRLGGSLSALWLPSHSWWICVIFNFAQVKQKCVLESAGREYQPSFPKIWPKIKSWWWKRSPCILVTFCCSSETPWWKQLREESLYLGYGFRGSESMMVGMLVERSGSWKFISWTTNSKQRKKTANWGRL